ncbi:hypothetical protein J416_00299 [Gracilibacillus halophilus YIM-C55.5]|uniref:VanZ-like domain-containing protein n=1 Tax=Gracilibacillus halophilus YIM-C55.5 TaxID=1308866 RepID=N4WZC3_9BACI|nr:VanZ family protein [Gracilibacillus halophilus]ENH98381.1 hypothetical protein J416_00299 [Gracilibacillus halophilus YIM-C55.5]
MKKWLYWLLPLGWMGVIFYSSAQPYQQQDIKPFLGGTFDLSFLIPYVDGISFVYHQEVVSVGALGIEGFIEFFIRKGAHFTVFFLLAIFFFLACQKTVQKRSPQLIACFAFFCTIVYAMFDEWHQSWTPNRTPYVGDILIDSIGAGFAIFCLLIWIKKKHGNRRQRLIV